MAVEDVGDSFHGAIAHAQIAERSLWEIVEAGRAADPSRYEN